MVREILAAVALLTAMPAIAAPAAQADPADALIERYFQTLKQGDPKGATDLIFSRTPAMQKNAAGVEAMAGNTATYLNYYGSVLGWQKVGEDVYASGVKREAWLLRTTNGPLFFKFDIYDGPGGEAVQKVTVTEDYDTGFEFLK